MFADDTVIYYSSKYMQTIENKLNADLTLLLNWIYANELAINVEKTEFMVIGSPQKLRLCSPINLILSGTDISRVETYKYLVVTSDSNLTWTVHTDELSKKVSSRIGMVRRVRPYLTWQMATFVYNTIISPLFDYCAVIWNSCNATASMKLQRLQNRAARVVPKADNSLPLEIALV